VGRRKRRRRRRTRRGTMILWTRILMKIGGAGSGSKWWRGSGKID
jgi:hypothetical protein